MVNSSLHSFIQYQIRAIKAPVTHLKLMIVESDGDGRLDTVRHQCHPCSPHVQLPITYWIMAITRLHNDITLQVSYGFRFLPLKVCTAKENRGQNRVKLEICFWPYEQNLEEGDLPSYRSWPWAFKAINCKRQQILDHNYIMKIILRIFRIMRQLINLAYDTLAFN